MTAVEVVNNAEDSRACPAEAPMAAADAVLAAGEDVDPVPIGEPDEDGGYDDDDDEEDEEDEEDDEEPLQCTGDD